MTDPRIAVLAAISSPDWHPVPEAHGMPWDEAEQLLAAYDASRAAAPSVPADADLRDRIRHAIAQEFRGTDYSADDILPDEFGSYADAVLAVLPTPANRAAVLREAADFVGNDDTCGCGGCDTCIPNKLAAELRRRADETPQPTKHVYLSTGCLHGKHHYCQNVDGIVGLKKPAQCKFCAAPCICGCHTAVDAQPTEVVHGCPPDGSGLTPCCGRSPFELPLTDRISSEAPTTCPGPTAEADRG